MSLLGPKDPKSARRRERGQTTAEFVLIVPFLLLFFFLIVDFGWMLKNWIVVTNSAREAARCTVAPPCRIDGLTKTAEELIEARIDAGITGNISSKQYDIKYVDLNDDGNISGGVDSIVVCVRASNQFIAPTLQMFSFVTGGSVPNPMPLAAREEMRIEGTPQSEIPVGVSQCFQ